MNAMPQAGMSEGDRTPQLHVPASTVPPLNLSNALALRAATPNDLDFLERVYADTRADELAMTDWDDAQKAAFVSFQFQAQHRHYTAHYHAAQYLIVVHETKPVGRLYLHWRTDDLRIVDVALLDPFRGKGLGSALLGALMSTAAAKGHGVSIHVESMNPAMRLYQRLGFQRIGEHGVYHLMQWIPNAN